MERSFVLYGGLERIGTIFTYGGDGQYIDQDYRLMRAERITGNDGFPAYRFYGVRVGPPRKVVCSHCGADLPHAVCADHGVIWTGTAWAVDPARVRAAR